MADLRRIERLPAAAAAALCSEEGIRSVEALWERLATAELPTTLAVLAKKGGVMPDDLREILADDAGHRRLESEPFEKPNAEPSSRHGGLRRHLPDAIVVVAAFALAAAVWLALARVPPAQKAAVATAPLPAGWVIGQGDVGTGEVRRTDGLPDPAAALGRVTLQRLAVGEVVRKSDLGPRVPATSLVVELRLAAAGELLRPGQTVSLVVGVGGERREMIGRALVLRVGETSATFAVGAAERGRLARLDADVPALPVRATGER